MLDYGLPSMPSPRPTPIENRSTRRAILQSRESRDGLKLARSSTARTVLQTRRTAEMTMDLFKRISAATERDWTGSSK